MKETIEARPGRPLRVDVDRAGRRLELVVTPSTETDTGLLETVQKGKIGIVSGRLPPYVAVLPGGRAAASDLRTFDRVTAVNGRRIANTLDLDEALKAPGALDLEVSRAAPVALSTAPLGTAAVLHVQIPAGEGPLGIEAPPDRYVREVKAGSPAAAAGLKPGDKLLSLGGSPIASGLRLEITLREMKLEQNPRPLHFEVERDGQKLDVLFTPAVVDRDDPMLGRTKVPEPGFSFDNRIYAMEPYKPEELVTVSYAAPEAMVRAVRQTVQVTRGMVLGIGGLFTRKVPLSSVGGPVMLFQLAGAAAAQGFGKFLELFALISVNLGLINLLPVPVLDGFHIVLSAVEGVSRRPVSVRVREVANYVGVAMLLALMLLAFFNDLIVRGLHAMN
jgi:regulator of sigma E protease